MALAVGLTVFGFLRHAAQAVLGAGPLRGVR